MIYKAAKASKLQFRAWCVNYNVVKNVVKNKKHLA